jgi:hypothetical protein
MQALEVGRQDRRTSAAIALAIPLFFPLLWWGRLPGPFALAQGDTFVFFEPYALEFMRALRDGTNPFWSHTSSFGSPTLLTLATGALHPLHLFHLLVPDAWAHALGWWGRLAVCGIYLFLYLRQLHVVPWIASAFTLAFLSGGFNINYSSEIIGYVMAFFPMLLFYADRVCTRPDIRRSDLALLALATLLVVLGGFLSVVLYLLSAAGVYILVRAASWRRIGLAAVACSAGVLIALPAIVETLAFYPQTGYDPAQRRWLYFYDPPAITALNLFIPSIFGNSADFRAAGMRDFFGSQIGAGIITLPVIAMGLVGRLLGREPFDRLLVFWLGTLVVCLALYFNVGSIKQLLVHVPVLREHPFTRLQTLIALSSAVAAALLLDRCARAGGSRRQWMLQVLTLVTVAAGAYLAAFYLTEGPKVRSQLVTFGAWTAIALATLAWAVRKPSEWASRTFVMATWAAGCATSLAFVPYFSPHQYYPDEPAIQSVKASLAPGARVLDVDNTMFRGAAIAYGIPSITNHWFSQPALREWVQSLSPDKGTQGLTLDHLASLDFSRSWPELRRMHVQFVMLPKGTRTQELAHGTSGEWRRLAVDSDRTEVIEVLYQGRSLAEGEGLSGAGYSRYREGGGHIRLHAQGPQLTLPVRHDAGWSSRTPGVTVSRDGMNLIQLTIEAGVTEVHLTYWPARWRSSLLLAVLGVTVMAGILYLLQRPSKPQFPHAHPTP